MTGKETPAKSTPPPTVAPTSHTPLVDATSYRQQVVAAAHTLQLRSSAVTVRDLHTLQWVVGNRAVQRVLTQSQPVLQAKGGDKKRELEKSGGIAAESDAENEEIKEQEEEAIEKENKRVRTEETAINTRPVASPPRKFERVSEMGFWMRTSVRAATDSVPIDPSTVDIIDITISPERRNTYFGKTNSGLQGAHLVAWSAMLRSWNAQLSGKLSDVVTHLETWLLEDHTAEPTSEQAALAPRRALALRLLAMLRQPQSINTILNRLEQAVGLFIETNQEGYFATQGKSQGGRDEAGGHNMLTSYNSRGESERGALSASQVLDEALKLIDIAGKTLDEHVMAKVVTTWYRMLKALYPNLVTKFTEDGGVEKHKFGTKTTNEWVTTWTTHFDAQKANTQSTLAGDTSLADNAFATIGGVTTNIRSSVAETDPLLALKLDQVTITALDIPAKLRAPTQFGAAQQSHTLAWTFLRQSLIAQFKDMNGATALAELEKLAKRDKESLSAGKPSLEIKSRANELGTELEIAKTKTMPLDEWVVVLNRLMFDFVTVNQALPTSTYAAAGQALGHGEAGANRAFKGEMNLPSAEALEKAAQDKEKNAEVSVDDTKAAQANEAKLNEVMSKAAKYMDLGQFYLPLLDELGEYASYKSRSAPLRLDFSGSLGDPTASAPVPAVTTDDKKAVDEQINLFFEKDSLTSTAKEPLKKLSLAAYNLVGNQIAELQVAAKTLDDTKVGQVELGHRLYKGEKLSSADDAIREPEEKELQKMMRRLDNIAEVLRNYRKINSEVSKFDSIRAANLQKRLSQPANLIAPLYSESGHVLRKVVGDYAMHLQYFKPDLYKLLRESSQAREKLLLNVLSDPLSPSEIRVGQTIKLHLMDDYQGFMNIFTPALLDVARKWTGEAFTHG